MSETASQQELRTDLMMLLPNIFRVAISGHVTLEKQGNRYACDCIIHLDSSMHLQGTAQENDPTAAFEAAADRVEKRLRRYKRRLKDHKNTPAKAVFADAAYAIVESPEKEDEIPDDYSPVIIAESVTSIETQSVAEAVMKLDLIENPFVVFTNAGNGRTNVVYRRDDGNIGWIDPS